MVFPAMVLQKHRAVRKAKDIQTRITRRMDQWEKGNVLGLIQDMELDRAGTPPPERTMDNDQIARKFAAKYCSGRVRQAVREVVNGLGGKGPMDPHQQMEGGTTVIKTMEKLHPAQR